MRTLAGPGQAVPALSCIRTVVFSTREGTCASPCGPTPPVVRVIILSHESGVKWGLKLGLNEGDTLLTTIAAG
jgi:hypothetical protein